MALLVPAAQASAAGSISGTVTDAVSEAAIEGAQVCFYKGDAVEDEWDFVGCEESDENGKYTAELPDDQYLVEFWAEDLGYITQYYDGTEDWTDGTGVVVGGEPVTGIDAALEEGGHIQGTVVDAASNAPIEAEVCAISDVPAYVPCVFTDAGGNFTIEALRAAKYAIEFWAPGYEIQYYDAKAEFDEATRVAVTPPETVSGIDARMEKFDLVPDPVTPPPTVTSPPVTPPVVHHKRKRCRKGFHRKRVHGKRRCVRIKKHRRRHHR
jgi:hypothetical protein